MRYLKRLPVLNATVHQYEHRTDIVLIHVNLPSPIVGERSDTLTLEFRATAGTGPEYLKQHFGIENVEIIKL